MTGLQEASSLSLVPMNTGVDEQIAMGPTKMLIMVPVTDKWQASDETTFLTYCLTKMHAATGRWFPLLGKNAPVRSITDNKENDVLQTFDDGSTAFIRSGMYARTFMTNKGGINYAKALKSFNGLSDWAFIEVASIGLNTLAVLRMKNSDGSFSGIPVNLAYSPTPKLADLKETYENSFYLNFSPDYYIAQSDIAITTDDLLGSLTGLKDVEIFDATGSTTTILKIGVRTMGSKIDLVALFPGLAAVGNFIVKNSSGIAVTVSSAAVNNGHIELTGTWTAGVWTIAGAAASVWKALSPTVSGYEAVNTLTITTS